MDSITIAGHRWRDTDTAAKALSIHPNELRKLLSERDKNKHALVKLVADAIRAAEDEMREKMDPRPKKPEPVVKSEYTPKPIRIRYSVDGEGFATMGDFAAAIGLSRTSVKKYLKRDGNDAVARLYRASRNITHDDVNYETVFDLAAAIDMPTSIIMPHLYTVGSLKYIQTNPNLKSKTTAHPITVCGIFFQSIRTFASFIGRQQSWVSAKIREHGISYAEHLYIEKFGGGMQP